MIPTVSLQLYRSFKFCMILDHIHTLLKMLCHQFLNCKKRKRITLLTTLKLGGLGSRLAVDQTIFFLLCVEIWSGDKTISTSFSTGVLSVQ